MKKTLAVLAVVSLMGSVAAKADSIDVKTSKVKTTKVAAHHMRQVTYITNVPATGSHLPVVVTRYGSDVRSNSSFIAYSAPQLDQTGQLNIGAQLNQRDPAISSVRGIH